MYFNKFVLHLFYTFKLSCVKNYLFLFIVLAFNDHFSNYRAILSRFTKHHQVRVVQTQVGDVLTVELQDWAKLSSSAGILKPDFCEFGEMKIVLEGGRQEMGRDLT